MYHPQNTKIEAWALEYGVRWVRGLGVLCDEVGGSKRACSTECRSVGRSREMEECAMTSSVISATDAAAEKSNGSSGLNSCEWGRKGMRVGICVRIKGLQMPRP